MDHSRTDVRHGLTYPVPASSPLWHRDGEITRSQLEGSVECVALRGGFCATVAEDSVASTVEFLHVGAASELDREHVVMDDVQYLCRLNNVSCVQKYYMYIY